MDLWEVVIHCLIYITYSQYTLVVNGGAAKYWITFIYPNPIEGTDLSHSKKELILINDLTNDLTILSTINLSKFN